MTPRLHDREQVVAGAELALRELLITWQRSADVRLLTDWEYVRVVTRLLGDQIGMTAKFAIRYERHGDTDEPGGLAADQDT